MSERPEPRITSKTEKPYTTLRGLVIKSTALIALGGAMACGYGINQIRLEESSANQEKARIVKEFNKTHSEPNSAQLLELRNDVNSINKFTKTSTTITTAGGTLMTLGLSASFLAALVMEEETRSPEKKKRENQPLTGSL